MAKITTVRLLLSIIAIRQWHFLQLYINYTFLNGDLFEEVYMDLPLGYPRKGNHEVCKLNKSIYGLCQASCQWFHKFSSALLAHGFTQSKNDYSPFYIGSGASLTFLLVYVDDIIICGPDQSCIVVVHHKLESLFKLKVLGELKYFLGLEIARSLRAFVYLKENMLSLSWKT